MARSLLQCVLVLATAVVSSVAYAADATTLVIPKIAKPLVDAVESDPLQADYDKMWTEYEEAVQKATVAIKEALDKQITKATDSGVLELVEMWEGKRKRFVEKGVLDWDTGSKASVEWKKKNPKVPYPREFNDAVRTASDLAERAKEVLEEGYADLVKEYTKAKNIPRAKELRDEGAALYKTNAGPLETPAATEKREPLHAGRPGQSAWLFCDLACNGNDPAMNHKVVSPHEILFPANPTKGRALLVSSQKYGKCVVRFEFMYDSPEMRGNPFVAVAARAPNLKGKEFTERWPFGIEFKLGFGGFGRFVLPHPEFKADMAYGQEREGRSVPPLKQQAPLRNGWNVVEIAVQDGNNVVAKGNGVTLNALGNAQNIEGHIVVFPPACEFRIRNLTVEENGTVTPLLFTSMSVMPCEKAQP